MPDFNDPGDGPGDDPTQPGTSTTNNLWDAASQVCNTATPQNCTCSSDGTATTLYTLSTLRSGGFVIFPDTAARRLTSVSGPGGGGVYTCSWSAALPLGDTTLVESGASFTYQTIEGVTASMPGPGGNVDEHGASEAAVEIYFAGYGLTFAHGGGPIGVMINDDYYVDNLNGQTLTTWALESENLITFAWQIVPAKTS